MKRALPVKPVDFLEFTQTAEPEDGYVLRVAVIYEDRLPSEWATQVSRRASQLVGPRCVRTAQWPVGALRRPAVMQDAIAAALMADILMVCVSGARELPADIHQWIDSWLPYRVQRTGALVAVIGTPSQPGAFGARIREYLHDVATLAHMDLLVQDRRLPARQPASSTKDTGGGAEYDRRLLDEIPPDGHCLRWASPQLGERSAA